VKCCRRGVLGVVDGHGVTIFVDVHPFGCCDCYLGFKKFDFSSGCVLLMACIWMATRWMNTFA
jgi:hypothetical protein